MKTVYKLTKQVADGKEVYGIEATVRIDDVFVSESDGIEMIRLCNDKELSILHIYDIADDYLQYREGI